MRSLVMSRLSMKRMSGSQRRLASKQLRHGISALCRDLRGVPKGAKKLLISNNGAKNTWSKDILTRILLLLRIGYT